MRDGAGTSSRQRGEHGSGVDDLLVEPGDRARRVREDGRPLAGPERDGRHAQPDAGAEHPRP